MYFPDEGDGHVSDQNDDTQNVNGFEEQIGHGIPENGGEQIVYRSPLMIDQPVLRGAAPVIAQSSRCTR